MRHTCTMNDMVREGATVAANLGPDSHLALTFDSNGHLPKLVGVRMLVDTGAEMSHISERIVAQIGLRYIDEVPIIGVNGVAEDRPVYLATLHLTIDTPGPNILPIKMRIVSMREHPSTRTKFDGLLGRSFLAAFELAYSGPRHMFALAASKGLGDSS